MTPQEIIKQAIDRTRRANDLNERIYRRAQKAFKSCLVISLPKFKRGDMVYDKTDLDPYYGPEAFKINSTFYNIEEGTYYYTRHPADRIVAEYDLEFYIEEKEAELPE